MSFSTPQKLSTGYFVPFGSEFKELLNAPANASFDDISAHLGYHSDQIHMFLGDYDPTSDIQAIGFEIFTTNIAFVCTQKSVVKLTDAEVGNFSKKFRFQDEFDDVTVSGILEEGIKNGSLTIEFLAKVLDLTDPQPTGIYFDGKFGLYLYFNNGLLTDVQPADGLNEWAKHFKQLNPQFIGRYENVARKYWGQDIAKITAEINIQASALADTPNSVNNEFVYLHEAELGTINFKMLMVCHYDHEIIMDEFKQINHGRYKHLPGQFDIGLQKYTVGKFLYEFSKGGDLINKYQL